MMQSLTRRTVLAGAVAGTVTIGSNLLRAGTANDDDEQAHTLWTLEGELKVHRKFVYRYFLTLLDGQKCALYGSDHSRDLDALSRVQLPARLRVRGTLGTDHHVGGTKQNPSPFPAGWWVYMNVHDVEVLK